MLKELRKLAYLSMALAAIAYSPHSANAAPVFTSAGSCTGLAFVSGASGADCVTTTGHISATVTDTLSINEVRAIGFGNMNKPCGGAACTGADTTIALDPTTGVRTLTVGGDSLTLLHGQSANDGGTAGGPGSSPGAANSGGQSPGILTITGANEGAATQVYISFADNAGNPVDFAGEDYWTANDTNIHVIGPGGAYFTAKDFTIACTGTANDVYGHFCDNATLPLTVRVGATLSTAAQTYVVGKYVGTYNAMVSY